MRLPRQGSGGRQAEGFRQAADKDRAAPETVRSCPLAVIGKESPVPPRKGRRG